MLGNEPHDDRGWNVSSLDNAEFDESRNDPSDMRQRHAGKLTESTESEFSRCTCEGSHEEGSRQRRDRDSNPGCLRTTVFKTRNRRGFVEPLNKRYGERPANEGAERPHRARANGPVATRRAKAHRGQLRDVRQARGRCVRPPRIASSRAPLAIASRQAKTAGNGSGEAQTTATARKTSDGPSESEPVAVSCGWAGPAFPKGASTPELGTLATLREEGCSPSNWSHDRRSLSCGPGIDRRTVGLGCNRGGEWAWVPCGCSPVPKSGGAGGGSSC